MLQSILDLLFSEQALAVVLAGVLGYAAKLVVNGDHRRRLALLAYHGFHAAEDAANEVNDNSTLDKVLDKVVYGLQAADEFARLNGWRELKPADKEIIKAHFQALHGVEIAKVKVAVKAEEALFPASPN